MENLNLLFNRLQTDSVDVQDFNKLSGTKDSFFRGFVFGERHFL